AQVAASVAAAGLSATTSVAEADAELAAAGLSATTGSADLEPLTAGSVFGAGLSSTTGQAEAGSTFTPASAAGRHTKRYGVRDGDRLLVFMNKADADAARKAIEAKNSSSPNAARALKRIKAAKILAQPVDIVPVALVRQAAESQHAISEYLEMARKHSYTSLINAYYDWKRKAEDEHRKREAMAREEEEIAVILLHL
ncbi:MAG TPA: hypothetical protein VML56_03610, partial [Burkholderiales bacterium]|nr:hypothetical protein [Burkholderiales bacterium]